MKKFVTMTLAILITSALFANSQEMFKIDETVMNTELQELYQLENFLVGKDLTFSSLADEDYFLSKNIIGTTNGLHTIIGLSEPPLGISSFLWGFCLGIPGIAIVYFVSEDSDETKKALWGCVAGSLLYTVVYVGYYALVIGFSSTL